MVDVHSESFDALPAEGREVFCPEGGIAEGRDFFFGDAQLVHEVVLVFNLAVFGEGRQFGRVSEGGQFVLQFFSGCGDGHA